MSRGNPDNLRKAAQAKQVAALKRAEQGLRDLLKRGQPITFEKVAAAGGVSKDFLYRTPGLRSRISQLRDQQNPATRRPAAQSESEDNGNRSASSIVRTLTTKLTAERARHRREISDLQNALAAAHGELLSLKRSQGRT